MKQKPRIIYTDNQKALMWERWRQGDSLQKVAQLFEQMTGWLKQAYASDEDYHLSHETIYRSLYIQARGA